MDPLIIRVFRQLSAADRRHVEELARCPYFNRRADVVRLCEYLGAHVGRSAAVVLRPERLFKVVYPGDPFDARRLSHVQSYLLDLVRQFVILQEINAEPEEQAPLLLRGLRRHGLDDLFEKTVNTQLQESDRAARRDSRYHFRRYQLHQEQVDAATQRERSARLNIRPLPDELTVFYVSEMLRHACLALLHEAVAGQTYQPGLMDAILAAVEKEELLRRPAVAVYYHAYHMLQKPADSAALEQLKSALLEHGRHFSPDEQRSLYLLAINGCIRRMNAGQRGYVRDAFDLYRAALDQSILLENGMLSGFNYKNIIRLAVALNEHEWAWQFLESHSPTLHPRERDNLYRYNRAFLHFQQQDYARAMPLLQQVDLEDPLNNLDARRMLLRSYFELGEWSALESLVQSFSAYLRRQKNLGYHRTTNENLLVFTKKLIETDKKDRRALGALRSELEATPEVAERAWLLSRLDQA